MALEYVCMESKFEIWQTGSLLHRPPISHEVRDYLVRFCSDNVFKKKKIIEEANWKIILVFHFISTGPRVKFKDIAFVKSPRTLSAENIKMFDVFVLVEGIQDSTNPYLRTIELMLEGIKQFITSCYKSVNPEFIDTLWMEINYDYLFSLPYPAPYDKQKYVEDAIA